MWLSALCTSARRLGGHRRGRRGAHRRFWDTLLERLNSRNRIVAMDLVSANPPGDSYCRGQHVGGQAGALSKLRPPLTRPLEPFG